MLQPILEAALKPSAAQSYPYLPARMWTTARRLGELVARYRGIPAEAVDRIEEIPPSLLNREHLRHDGCSRRHKPGQRTLPPGERPCPALTVC